MLLNHKMCQIFRVKNGKCTDTSLKICLCSVCLRHDSATVGNYVINAIGDVFTSIVCFSLKRDIVM